MRLSPDLRLQGNDFTNAATAFFIAYLIAEIPNGWFFFNGLSPLPRYVCMPDPHG